MGCVFSFRMAPDVSFTSAADAPSAAGIRDFLAGFASMMQRYEKFLIPANFFPTFFQKSAQKGLAERIGRAERHCVSHFV